MASVGTATINFGAFPGANETSVAVTGQSGILSTSNVEAWFMRDSTTDHTADDHSWVALFVELTCSVPNPGTGFTIYAKCADTMVGSFTVRWVWS